MNAKNIYFSLVHWQLWHLYAASFSCLVIMVGGWWYCMHNPLSTRIENLQKNISTLQGQQTRYVSVKQELAGLTKSLSELKLSLQNYKYKQPYTDVLQQTLALIVDTALNAGIMINSCKLCAGQNNSWCNVNDILFDGKGTFDQIIVFFESLKKSKKLVDCTKCEIARCDANIFGMQVVFNSLYI